MDSVFGFGRYCRTNPNNWKKYFYAFSTLGILYIYLEVINSSYNVRKLSTEVDSLKSIVKSTDPIKTLYKIETVLKDLRYEQTKQQEKLQKLVAKELETFSSDKTGKTDFALEMTGGKFIQLTPGTDNFDNAKTLFGITLCEGMHGPRAMLQADMSPGSCWALKGSYGGVIIQLLGKVQINGVSLEHISKQISPTGETSSAPKEFSVWGKNFLDDRGELLGTFTYNALGPLVQTFPINNENYYDLVEFRVTSNHGNPDFTCVYRFRVHGVLEKVNGKV